MLKNVMSFYNRKSLQIRFMECADGFRADLGAESATGADVGVRGSTLVTELAHFGK